MRVLHVITGLQKAAGTSVFCGELCQALNRSAIEQPDSAVHCVIAVCDPNTPDSYFSECPDPADVPVRSIAPILGEAPAFDLIHLHALWDPVLHRVVKYAKRHGIPYVMSPHGMLTPWALSRKRLKKWTALALYQYWDLQGAALVHTTAPSEVDDVRRLQIRPPIVVAPLGVTLPAGSQNRRAPEQRAPRQALFISRVHPKKGLFNLVDAWAKIRPQGWKMIVAGPDQDGHTAAVKARAEAKGVGCDFDFVGPVFDRDKDRLYANADLFVLPTHSENFGVVVIEALAYGVPVITTKGAPWAELQGTSSLLSAIVDRPVMAQAGRCGWWIDVGMEPLAKTLREAMALTDEERHAMGENGQYLVAVKYTWSAVAQQMTAAYEWVLKGGEKPECVRV